MITSNTPTPDADRTLESALHRVWGFSSFRPLQREAMEAILAGRDSVVVLPTGGGKSLCARTMDPLFVTTMTGALGSRSSSRR
jgi:ATP-dependent helicase YprA (DUF1998 family)